MPKWVGTERANKFIELNPSVEAWLKKIPGILTKNVYGQTLQQITEAIGYGPEKLLDIRTNDQINGYEALGMRTPITLRNHDRNGYAIIDKVTDFLTSGTMQVKRGRKPALDTVQLADLSVSRRQYMYAVIKSFFKWNRCELPDEKLAIVEQSRTKKKDYVKLEDARKIIGALKQPYRTLCEVALYSGMGVGELCLLNELWSEIRKQLDVRADPVRVDFSRRKSNLDPYFTFIPSRLLIPFKDQATPFKNNMGNVINPMDIDLAFKYGKKRAGVNSKAYPHMIRDLFRTQTQYRAGMDGPTSNYLMGHSLKREMGYLQPDKEPEKVLEQWRRWETYLDKGVTSEMDERLKASQDKIAELERKITELQDWHTRLDRAAKKSRRPVKWRVRSS